MTLELTHKTAYIGLGSNLEEPVKKLQQSLALLDSEATQLRAVSTFYVSKPQGPQDQPDYVNAVAKIETQLLPEALLIYLQQIEQQLGKVKKRHWGERCIDLDLLLYGDETPVGFKEQSLNLPHLQLPHPMMTQRDFVLLPLQELAPTIELSDPSGKRQPITGWLEQLTERFVDFSE